jgi:hypothetical protein
MGFAGRLEDLSVTDIIQIVSLGKRTGKLTLTRRKQQGLIVFLDGGIVYCRSNSVHETLGSILVSRNLINESTLLAALDLQQSRSDLPLGGILVEMGAVEKETLDELVREQIKNVLSELILWDTGVFQFESVDLPAGVSAALDANEFLVDKGLRAEEMVLELLTSMDESKGERDSKAEPVEPEDELRILDADQARKGPARGAGSRGFASLKSIMMQMRDSSLTFTGEITLMLLRYAAELVNRSVLFAVRPSELIGIGQFGIELDAESADARVRQIRIPVDEISVLQEVIKTGEPYRGRLINSPWNTYLMQQLGGRMPREVFAAPIIVDGKPMAVIYGDNLPEETVIGPIEGLELLMIEASLIIEKHNLEARLRSIEDESQ